MHVQTKTHSIIASSTSMSSVIHVRIILKMLACLFGRWLHFIKRKRPMVGLFIKGSPVIWGPEMIAPVVVKYSVWTRPLLRRDEKSQ